LIIDFYPKFIFGLSILNSVIDKDIKGNQLTTLSRKELYDMGIM